MAFAITAAERGELVEVASVRVFDEGRVPSPILVQMLQHLGQPHDWVEANREYPLYLSEV